jgi:hypothetical protein
MVVFMIVSFVRDMVREAEDVSTGSRPRKTRSLLRCDHDQRYVIVISARRQPDGSDQ